jgi:hypothetical protein
MGAEMKMKMKFLGRTLTAYEPLVGFPTSFLLPPTSSTKKKKTLHDATKMTDDTEKTPLPKKTDDAADAAAADHDTADADTAEDPDDDDGPHPPEEKS